MSAEVFDLGRIKEQTGTDDPPGAGGGGSTTLLSFGVLGKIVGDLFDQFKDVITDPVAFARTIADAFAQGLCGLVDSKWKRKLIEAGAIAAGAPPQAVQLLVKAARALCSLIPVLQSDADDEIKAVAALVVLVPILAL